MGSALISRSRMAGIRRRSAWVCCSFLALVLARPLPAAGHASEPHAAPPDTPAAVASVSGLRADIEEKLGETIPRGLTFVDPDGAACALDPLLQRPTILVLIYYACTAECNPVLENLAGALREIPQQPGTDYQVLVISFDATETADQARSKRDTVMQLVGPAFPREAWRFLRGDAPNLETLTRSVGFHFLRRESGLVHSTALVFLAPGGKIVRYLHGTTYLPAEIALALTEAEAGATGSSIRKMLSYCFSYDPASRRYTTGLLRVAGLVVALGVVILLVLVLRPRRPGPRSPGDGSENG